MTYSPGGWNQKADALSHKLEYTWAEDKMPLWSVIPVEKFAATQVPVDLKEQIQLAQHQDQG